MEKKMQEEGQGQPGLCMHICSWHAEQEEEKKPLDRMQTDTLTQYCRVKYVVILVEFENYDSNLHTPNYGTYVDTVGSRVKVER